MQQSVLKSIALSSSYCSTCFGHYNAHHQELVKLPLQPLVSSAGDRLVHLLRDNPLASAQDGHLQRKPEAATAV
jgi:hypothetical protein